MFIWLTIYDSIKHTNIAGMLFQVDVKSKTSLDGHVSSVCYYGLQFSRLVGTAQLTMQH